MPKSKASAPLNITFHNFNQGDDLVKALIKVAAQVATASVGQALLHSPSTDDEEPMASGQ